MILNKQAKMPKAPFQFDTCLSKLDHFYIFLCESVVFFGLFQVFCFIPSFFFITEKLLMNTPALL